MHMADALLSPAVGGVMCAVSAGAVAVAAAKIKKDHLDEKKIPMMGVMGAFVFAAQMINFTIPGTGSSGHIGGGILLASILGEFPGLLAITAVLLIQALFFADGGLLALGCNVFNMGVVMCLLAYPLLFKPIVRKGFTKKRIFAASIVSVVVGLQAGAFCVVLETLASGVTELPFGAFVALMQPIHLAIGAVEGVITGAVLCFVYQMRPEILESANDGTAIGKSVSMKRVLLSFAVFAVLIGGGLSLAASSNPDGLEWSIAGVTGGTELEAEGGVYDAAAELQQSVAILPDYDYRNAGEDGSATGTTVSGLVGGAMVLAVSGIAGAAIYWVKRRKKQGVS